MYWIFAVIVGVLIILYLLWDNLTIGVQSYKVQTSRIQKAVRIVMVSDLHARRYFQNIPQIIKNQKPDLILLAGDMIEDRSHKRTRCVTYPFFRTTAQIAPVFAIFGNHERRVKWQQEVWDEMKRAGIRVLENEMVHTEAQNQPFVITGLDEGAGAYGRFHTKTPQKLQMELLKKTQAEDGVRIVMDHYPENFANAGELSYNQCTYEVMVAGHAHGGQVRLPLIGGLYAPGQGIFPRYTKGIYRAQTSTLIVSNGLGGQWYLPRFGNRPSVYVIDMIPEE